MIYVYDTILDETVSTLRRYGITFTLDKRFRMGKVVVYTYSSLGGEKILAIPTFAQQYREVEAKFKRFGKNKSLDAYLKLICNRVDPQAFAEEISDSESETGKATLITAQYKDIQIMFQYMNGKLYYHDEFTICDNNPFGVGDIIWMNQELEEDE